jgi:hypothetical protein
VDPVACFTAVELAYQYLGKGWNARREPNPRNPWFRSRSHRLPLARWAPLGIAMARFAGSKEGCAAGIEQFCDARQGFSPFAKKSMRRPLLFGAKGFDRPPSRGAQGPKRGHDGHAGIYGAKFPEPFECRLHLSDFRSRWPDDHAVGNFLARVALAFFEFGLGHWSAHSVIVRGQCPPGSLGPRKRGKRSRVMKAWTSFLPTSSASQIAAGGAGWLGGGSICSDMSPACLSNPIIENIFEEVGVGRHFK